MRWRAYTAALVRYEQLLRAGATGAAPLVSRRVAQLEQDIRKDRELSGLGASAGVNLVMDALNGAGDTPADPPEFLEIADAPDEQEARKIWEKARDGADAGD